jgi:hypothetical protein
MNTKVAYIAALALTCMTIAATAQTAPPGTVLPRAEEVKVLPPSTAESLGAHGGGLQFLSYNNGRLQILADDSALSDILTSIGPLIGARIEVPSDLANERVAVNLASVSPKDALGALLGQTRYDYVIMGSPEHPEAINQVIIRVRSASAAQAVTPVKISPPSQAPLAKDFYGEARLANGLTPQEQALSREELYQKYLSAQQTQRQQSQAQDADIEVTGPKLGRH